MITTVSRWTVAIKHVFYNVFLPSLALGPDIFPSTFFSNP